MIADQPRGAEPAPPSTSRPARGALVPAFPAPASPGPRRTGPSPIAVVVRRLRTRLPRRVKVLVPAVVLVAALGAARLVTSADGGSVASAASVSAAREAGLSESIADAQAGQLVRSLCASEGRSSQLAELGEQLATDPVVRRSGMRGTIQALGAGAAASCPSAIDGATLTVVLDELQCHAVRAFVTSAGGSNPSLAPCDRSPTRGEAR